VSRELPRSALSVADEATVVALAMAVDDAAYGELVRRRQSLIRNLLRRLCRDPALADDLSQQTFLAAWRNLSSLRSPGAFGGWLRKLAVNVWLQHARRPGSRLETPTPDPSNGTPQPAYESAVSEQLDLDRALALMPEDVRVCIVLAYSERMSHREIAEASGFPLGTVKSHIARGSARLREILHSYG
jgi:RNA polymerase sigma factor (sigma-70 family)